MWEARNLETIDRWLQLKGCHLFKTVAVGGCKHASMPWQLEERKKRAVFLYDKRNHLSPNGRARRAPLYTLQ